MITKTTNQYYKNMNYYTLDNSVPTAVIGEHVSASASFSLFRKKSVTLLFTVMMIMTTTLKAQTLELHFNKGKLEQILTSIKQQTGYSFVINASLLKDANPINVSLKGGGLDEALKTVLSNTNLQYQIKDRSIIITEKSKTKEKKQVSKQNNLSLIQAKVIDENGNPLVGATIQIFLGPDLRLLTKTSTKKGGNFDLTNIPADATVEFSFLGYLNKQVKASALSETIKLEPQFSGLDEVLVVGYTTTTRRDNLASVVQVEAKDIAKQTVSNLGDAIVGRLPGLIVSRTSGNVPGSTPTFAVRGQNTLTSSNNSPLLVIDGVPTSENLWSYLSPNDIESVSVVKDAAAAVYGARAANGVILVTTKRGSTGKPTVQYGGSLNVEYPSSFPKSLDSWLWATLYNEAQSNDARLADGSIPDGFTPTYTEEDIERFRNGSDPDHYPNTNWYDEAIKLPGISQFHNLAIRGGNEQSKYFISAGYNDQGGLIRNVSNKRYSIRSNVDMNVNKNFNIGVDLSASLNNTHQPSVSTLSSLYATPPIYANQYVSDPTRYGGYPVGGTIFRNPYVESVNGDYSQNKNSLLNAVLRAEHKIPFLEGLYVKGQISYYRTNLAYKSWSKNPVIYTDDGTYLTLTDYRGASLSQTSNTSDNLTIDAQLGYERAFTKHTLKGIVLVTQTQESYTTLGASRSNFASGEIDQLNFGDITTAMNSGTGTGNSRRSLVGQFGYRYDARYMVDFNFRYDGSSNFLDRWGFFPAVSAGWNVAEESFVKNNRRLSFINLFKLRASYGIIGNDLIDRNFAFLDQYSINAQALVLNGNTQLSVTPSALGNAMITWEKENSLNFGLDFDLWNGFLGGSVDVFSKERYDILSTSTFAYPSTFGIALPVQNLSTVSNHGLEVMLKHGRTIGHFNYTLRPNFSVSRGKVIYVPENQSNPLLIRTGRSQDYYTTGYQAVGLFQSMEDIESGPRQAFGTVQPGDIKYADLSGPNGVPDNVIDSWDRTFIGNPTTPRIQFGLITDFSYRCFDLSFVFQGAAKTSDYYYLSPAIAFEANQQTAYEPHLDRWTPDNPNASYPRLSLNNANNSQVSSYWIQDASYVRLKNVVLGYNMDQSHTKRAGLIGLRVFIAGANLLTIDGMEFYDPEAQGQSYPMPIAYTLGIDVKF